jgi:hypothetical protein
MEDFSQTFEELYGKVLEKCAQEEARRALQIIVAAQRPLSRCELDVAFEIGPDTESCRDLNTEGDKNRKSWARATCGLFVSVVDSRVFLIHQTATEFLLRYRNDSPRPQKWKHTNQFLRYASRIWFSSNFGTTVILMLAMENT